MIESGSHSTGSFAEKIAQADLQAYEQFAAIKEKIAHYFYDIETDCPYGMPFKAVFHQAYFAPLEEHVMELFLASGYRRNGNCLYTMKCPDCNTCVSIRMIPELYLANRNQKRTWKTNSDLAYTVEKVIGSEENVGLCNEFLSSRYPKDNSAMRYYKEFFQTSIVSSVQLQFRKDEKLIGSSIVDVGANWLNAVYFFFDPAESSRSLGTFNIMTLIDMCRKRGLEYLYLGYYIKEVGAMNYKARFKPHQLLLDGKWETFQKKVSR